MRSILLAGASLTVVAALAAPAARADRPDTPGSDELFRFDAGDVVEVSDTEHFRIHYTRAGTHKVPAADVDTSGVPDHVEELGALYEDVLTFYTGSLGFVAPVGDNGIDVDNNDARFDVYLVDFNFGADGAFRSERCDGDVCSGFMVQENDFAGYGYPSTTYANRLLASHEFFHAVQAAYSASQGSVLGEGTAVWASERFDPSLDDLEGFSQAYLDNSDRPLNADGSGPVDSFTYGSSIFWEYLGESLGDAVIRSLWEAVADASAPDWFDVLDGVIRDAGGDGFAALFTDFATATLMTGDRADATRGFADGAALPELTFEGESLPFFKDRHLVFISAYRTSAVNPGDRSALRVALAGEGVNVDGLRLVVAPLAGDSLGDIHSSIDGEALDITVDASAADFVIFQVINTRQTGDGARPALCAGSPAEVDDCLAALAPPPDAEPPPDDEAPPGCSFIAAHHTPAGLALLFLVRLLGGRGVRRTVRGQNRSSR